MFAALLLAGLRRRHRTCTVDISSSMPDSAIPLPCPCSTCKRTQLQSRQTVRKHLQADAARHSRPRTPVSGSIAGRDDDQERQQHGAESVNDPDFGSTPEPMLEHLRGQASLSASPRAQDTFSDDEDPLEDPRFSNDEDEHEFEPASLSDEDEDIHVEDGEDIRDEPLFVSRDSLLEDDGHGGNGEDCDDDDSDDEQGLPPAFADHPAVRNAYIRAFVAAVFEHANTNAVRLMLDGSKVFTQSLQAANPDVEIAGLEDFAVTLRTVERRLGVDPDRLVRYHFACTECWMVRPRRALASLHSPNCTADNCNGLLYTLKRTANGKEKRVPLRVVPYVFPHTVIKRMMLRPGKFNLLQHWRGVGDQPRVLPPANRRGFENDATVMRDIYDGWGWRAIQAGLRRRQGGRWGIEDVDYRELDQRFVSLPCGLVWQMNIDWWVFDASRRTSCSPLLKGFKQPRILVIRLAPSIYAA